MHLHISNRIYWKAANDNTAKKPLRFIDFRDTDSLELIRLAKGTWSDVNEVVSEDNCNGRRSITVHGRLHGHMPVLVRNVKVEIIADTLQQHEVWLARIRARIAPWKLLQQEMQDIANRAPLCDMEELKNSLGGLFPSDIAAIPSSSTTDKVEGKRIDNLSGLHEKMEKLAVADELILHGTAGVETGATLTKLVTCVTQIAETAEFVADVTKCVTGMSTVFHLISLGAQGVSMCAEARRGRRVLPVALGQIVILLRYVLESLTEILRSSKSVDEIDKDFMFNVLKRTLCTMDIAEAQLLRGWGGQIVKSSSVQEVEQKIEELEPLVVIARNTSRGCLHGRRLKQLEKEREVCGGGLHHVRPSTSGFFAGRTRELGVLKSILEKWGSAVVTQYGGVGKTALMTAFADRAEKQELVPGGVFWVTADGGESDVVVSLVGLVEKLTRRRMGEEERRNPNLVIAELRQALLQRPGRWLLCLDNADNIKVSGILNEVCEIAVPQQDNGWVVVTSRQGQPRVCSQMKSDQELVLEPLCEDDAMVALWRRSQLVRTNEQDDNEVMMKIKDLESEDRVEFCALKELCKDEGGHGLGGLPLALVQAGSFIAQFKCSFAKYLDLFTAANTKEDLQDIMKNSEELAPIRESQRSIWTTWRISVGRLSQKAYKVLRAMAMLGEGSIGEAIVNRMLQADIGNQGVSVEAVFRNVIVEELVYGSSLVRCDDGGEGRVYRMHRLVRRFILNGTGRGSDVWNEAYGLALFSVHDVVEMELEKDDISFSELSYSRVRVFGNNHREFIVHALALLDHYELPAWGSDNPYGSIVERIHWYCGRLLYSFDNPQKEVHVWERLLGILQYRQAENRKRRWIIRFLDLRHGRNRGKDAKGYVATINFNLGGAHRKMGRLEEAVFNLEHCLEMRRAMHRHDKVHPDISDALHDLALVCKDQGNYQESAKLLKQSLEMERAVYSGEVLYYRIAHSFCNLGDVYRLQGKLDEALEMLQWSLEMRRAIHGRDKAHPEIADSLNDLALVYRDQGNYNEAAKLFKQSLEMYRRVYGTDSMHSDVAKSLWNLGDVYRLQGKLDEALEIHELSLEMRRAIHGHDKSHPDIAYSLNCLGLVYHDQEKYDAAAKLFEQSLEMYQIVHGAKSMNPMIAFLLCNLANVYVDQGKLDEALHMHEQSLEMRRAIHGHSKSHPDIALSLWCIGFVFLKQQKLDQAVEWLEQSVEMLRNVHGQNSQHPDIMAVLLNLEDIFDERGRLDDAIAMREQISP